jgi:glycosyltransferase involved in cell wall biosynthesis
MRIGVNLIGLRPGVVGGLETYIQGLLGELVHVDGVRLSAFASSEALETLSGVPGLHPVPLFDAPYSTRRRILAETITLPRALREHLVDVLFSPCAYAPLRVPAALPQVATIHDLQHLSFPRYFSGKVRLGRAALHWHTRRHCDRIIAISEFTRQELISRFSLPPERVATILSGVRPSRRSPDDEIAQVRTRYRLPRRFFYYPATMAPHKNHPFLLEVMSVLSRRDPDAPHLVLSGKKTEPELTRLEGLVQTLGLRDRVLHMGFVPFDDVWRVLSAAEALVFPSEFEGFGLPAIEAQQCGVPVVASDIPALREVVEESGLLLPLGSPDLWASTLAALQRDASERERLVRAGLENVRRFSWARCAEETAAVLRDCVSGPILSTGS